MKTIVKLVISILIICLGIAVGVAEPLPTTAKKMTLKEFQAFADKKRALVTVFDAGRPVKANVVWNWSKRLIAGSAVIDGETIPHFECKLSFSEEKACGTCGGEKKPSCHAIYLDGAKFFEVNDDGSVHAVSEISG